MFDIQDKKVVIFGAGSYMKQYYHILQNYKPACFWDNNSKLAGETLFTLNIEQPVNKNSSEPVFIIIASSFYNEICEQLESLDYTYMEDFCYLYDIANYHNVSIIPNGHYYSPIPDMKELFFDLPFKRYQRSTELLGIDLNYQSQDYYFNLFLENNKVFQTELFNKFSLNNGLFENGDALSLFTVFKEKRPGRVIEVGSGYTSALFLDCNNYLKTNTEFTFIEPYPERLYSILEQEDIQVPTIYEDRVQGIHPSVFQELSENDILFIDSTHVSKFESDVNYLIFEILPLIKKGVIIHFHDIFNQFEYPTEWIYKHNRFWNEAYLLRAFLQFNDSYRIIFWPPYMINEYSESVPENISNSGGSIWIEKIK